MLTGKEIVLGVTGSIAAYKAVELLRELIKREASVTVVMTEGARQFITPLTFATLSKRPVLTDLFTLDYHSRIAHLSTAEGADLLLVAPATANILGKFANGLADDLLTNLFLAAHVPIVIAPAMDLHMWQHPAVQENVRTLQARGIRFVGPEIGELASGLYGPGRLAEILEIIRAIEAILVSPQDLVGMVVLVTAGPTQEPLDPVRYVSNRSSGKMGYAIAEAALARGAKVILVSGPTSLKPPSSVETSFVQTAEEMREAVLKHLPEATIIIKAAAVADYRPVRVLPSKLKKTGEPLTLELIPTPDILEELGKKKEGRILVGFAAETENVIEHAREKLSKKNLDFVVANDVTKEGSGFASETNLVTILDREGHVEELPLLSKKEVAHRILDRVVALLQKRRGG
ncbi:MAG: bifunctional phosphopantothenoylcysteine decarboxylase/phosphopantothenate--cysteine ligase CoaBC [candidate division NC10 bacterium]|nr:bifunctional phosphopantothenoylcysteine decarboxylase/phosphopantothenate--cysteine ligase CoaBC [candidate division NC10 bacterium]